ncbi:hypothetical protein HS1genome_1119 [Sulfodiicoccus acidiphilus]|uniref:CdvA-like coiled-coil domain-containing protein n=1 Tax=Sulfodiicoccus acidiphilus TaxID=1670455 RepID=A0A348B3H8_9CREN|nr:cell division protein CdvA [Sulfodiicoccus acidiphilus]BBD72730.1 hypothetical protein HS1genome_1119 [Sulfodiicoccus acidiphilus]GGT95240.1 hypothetical protein GCM10007116_10890 [Sulfodiicoccus acidiphilus]
MPLSQDILVRYVGRKVKDVYGRDFGYLIHVYSEIDGQVTGVEIVNGSVFQTIDPARFKVEGESLYVLPEWKAEAMRVVGLLDKIRKRQKALEELYSKGEINKSMYDDMKRKLDSEAIKLKEDHMRIRNKLRGRLNEIEDQLVQIDKAMTAVKVSYIASETPEEQYKSSVEVLRQGRESYGLEKDDIKKTLDRLDSQDKEPVEIKPSPIAVPSEPKKEEQSIQLPFPIKVVNNTNTL